MRRPAATWNVRNGSTPKTVRIELGVGRCQDAAGSPRHDRSRAVHERQTRLAGLDDRILVVYADGMAVRDIAAYLQELYGVQIGRDTISRVTDQVLEDINAWRSRSLEAIYPIVYFAL